MQSIDPLFVDPNDGDYHLRSEHNKVIYVGKSERKMRLWATTCSPILGLFREIDRSQPRALPLQSRRAGTHRIATAPALGEGDAEAVGNGL